MLPANGKGSKTQGILGSRGGRQRVSLPAVGTGPTGQGTHGCGGSGRSLVLPESSSSTCSPGPQPSVPPNPAPITVRLTRQQQFHQALMQTCHGIARCVRIAMQGLGQQRREPLSEDSLVAPYMVGRHFAESMRSPMQESSDVILRCTRFSAEIPRNHLGYLHAGVRVVNNAWIDDGGEEAMDLLLQPMAEPGVQPPPPPDPMTPDHDPPSLTSQPVRCDSDRKIHLVVSLVTKVHPVMQMLCTRMIRCEKGTQRRPQA